MEEQKKNVIKTPTPLTGNKPHSHYKHVVNGKAREC